MALSSGRRDLQQPKSLIRFANITMEILGLVDIPMWLILPVCTVLLLYIYGTWNYTIFSSQGIPGPKPLPFFGNALELLRTNQFDAYTDWGKKYGKVVGFFMFNPSMVVTDLDLMKEIMVKKFPYFVDRDIPNHFVGPTTEKSLFFAGGTTWARIRNIMSPAFSTSKLKLMTHFVDRSGKLLMKKIEHHAETNTDIDVKVLFSGFTMDVISGTAFGLETNSQTEKDEPFITHCKSLFGNVERGRFVDFMMYLIVMFPFLGHLLRKRQERASKSEHVLFFTSVLEQMIDHRRQGKTEDKGKTDMLQILVNAEANPEEITDIPGASDETKNHKRLTKEEIIAQGFIVFFAGFETTATTLQYLTYNLTLNPDVQEKLYDEIMEKIGQDDPTYENVLTLKYLDAVIRETLRLFPPVGMVNRRVRETITINGVVFNKGCGVIIPIRLFMHDPKYFPDPEKFIPERFFGKNREKLEPMLIDFPFGYGQRQCIGMRLALMEVKCAAVKICRAFRFLKCADTPEKIFMGKGFSLAIPHTTIKVKAEARDV